MDYTIINQQDVDFYGHTRLYAVSFDPYSPICYAAYADNESDALDCVVDYCGQHGYVGYFLDNDEQSEAEEDNVGIVYAGNHGLAIDGDNLQIFIVKV